MRGSEGLPEGWDVKKLGDVAKTGAGGTPLKSKKEYYKGGDIPWLLSGEVSQGEIYKSRTYITKLGLEKSSAKLLPANSILVAMYGATAGQVGILRFEASTNQAVCGILPNKFFISEFIFYYFLSIKAILLSQASGNAQPNISQAKIKQLLIPIPPLTEQKRIVKSLDKAFKAIEQAKANIEKNIENAKELFQSKLNEIFSQRGDSWKEKTIKEITTILGDGLHGTPKYVENGEYYFINGNNLNDGKIIFKDRTKKVSFEEYEKYKKNLNERTIFVSINGTLGNVAFYNNEKIILGKSACYFNLLEGINKDFIKYVLISPQFIKYLHVKATGATIKNVSLKSMREYKVNLPNLKEQKAIVLIVNNLSGKSKKLIQNYYQKISDLDELKKSILQKAFRGELSEKDIII